MKLFKKKVETENTNEEVVKMEEKSGVNTIVKVVVGAGLGAAALGTAVYKYFTRKKDDGYSDLPAETESEAEAAPTAAEEDFAE